MNEKLKERFEKYVFPEPNTGCWIWGGGLNGDGYGRFYDSGKFTGAHRVSYRIFKGEIPEGLVLDHLCRVRHCVNPMHLEAVTSRENTLRGDTYIKSDYCPHCGSKFITETFSSGRTYRRCIECKNNYSKDYYQNNKDKWEGNWERWRLTKNQKTLLNNCKEVADLYISCGCTGSRGVRLIDGYWERSARLIEAKGHAVVEGDGIGNLILVHNSIIENEKSKESQS